MKTLQILLVEDDAIISGLLVEILAEIGHRVCAVATTEAEAVNAASQYRPDLIILDAYLHKGSGVSAIDRILCSGFIPHVFVTGDPFSVRGLRPTAIVIQKPFREADLVRAIHLATDAAAIS